MPNISSFKANFAQGGARSNQFRVDLAFPGFVPLGIVAALKGQFLCKATTLPGSSIDNVNVFYRGRPVGLAGERQFQPWTITVYNDGDFAIRNAFEQWTNGIMNFNATEGLVNPKDYQVDLTVNQLDRNGNVLKVYNFTDAYPTNISDIQLDYEDNNRIEVFQVQFQYNNFTSQTGATGSGKGNVSANATINTPVGSFPL